MRLEFRIKIIFKRGGAWRIIRVYKMASVEEGGEMEVSTNEPQRLSLLYPQVEERETHLPRQWSSKDKYSYIGLSQNNLRVHYKGVRVSS